MLLNIKVPKGGFHSVAIEEPFQFLKEPSMNSSLKNHFFLVWRAFFHYKEPFVQWKVKWMLKVLHGTIDANKEPLFLRV